MPRSKALLETAYLSHHIAPGGAISRQITGSSLVGRSWLINIHAVETHKPQTRRLHSAPRAALHNLSKQQPSSRVALARQTATSQFKSPPARRYATSRSRPGPLGTAFLLSINPFSTTTKDSSSPESMSSKLIPANPADVMVIRHITPNVTTFSVPFKRFGTIPVGGRGTVGK